jgi:putative tricarboxylic transport membrane protein
MRRPYQITSIVLLGMAAFLAREALKLRYYSPLGPGPGFFPVWLAVLLVVLAAAMLWQATFRTPEAMPDDFFPDRSGYLRIAAVLGALVWVIVLMDSLGFCLVMLAFHAFLLVVLGRQHPVVTGIIALAGSFGVYYVFVHWLGVPLPMGVVSV